MGSRRHGANSPQQVPHHHHTITPPPPPHHHHPQHTTTPPPTHNHHQTRIAPVVPVRPPTGTPTATFTPFNTGGASPVMGTRKLGSSAISHETGAASPVMGTKKLGGSIISHEKALHVRTASREHNSRA